ncbi:hypothetical protein BDV95DRAFT_143226 [Massariosphaeria phaeospora]|uniref:C2H2-type domain-containing protein n=1 Tax=Massariosphaeria phaeospora TaxID=100035 RepID=A0A7C8MI01_9PLEO|nr:hypothetical protein BDV95DRAFT_143226 [Massariosphaeria phaeospora]
MRTLLVVTLLLTLLLEPATASSFGMDHTLAQAPVESYYSDPDGILDAVCQICGASVGYCAHVLTNPPRRAPTFTAGTFYDHPQWPRDALSDLDVLPEPELLAHSYPMVYNGRQPLREDLLQQLNEDATTIRPSTIIYHLEDTYNPGDRLAASAAESPRLPGRRQPPSPGGFPCTVASCPRTFDRSCDRKRHLKTHLDRSERPHKCEVCHEGFLYPKDRNRHQRTHSRSSSPQATLYCPHPGCNNIDGFSRRDNLMRHQRKKHNHVLRSL